MTVTMDRTRTLTAAFLAQVTTHRVPVYWLASYGLTAEQALTPDGNGVPIWEDFYSGIDPTNSQSRFIIVSIQSQNGTDTVTWLGGTNGSLLPYGVLSAPVLTGAWTLVSGDVPRSPIGTNTWSGADPGTTAVFYRIQVNGVP